MATETSADTKRKGGRFTFTRIALVSILAGGWLLIWLDQPSALTNTKIHPGSNVGVGKDYTLFALKAGTVRYGKSRGRTLAHIDAQA